MGSNHNAFEANRVAAGPTTTDSFTLKLTGTPFPWFRLGKPLTRAEWTGLRVELDPQGSYKPSRILGLTIDDVDRSVSFPSRDRLSPWAWELENEAAV
jgi:hypothetical protein